MANDEGGLIGLRRVVDRAELRHRAAGARAAFRGLAKEAGQLQAAFDLAETEALLASRAVQATFTDEEPLAAEAERLGRMERAAHIAGLLLALHPDDWTPMIGRVEAALNGRGA